MPRIHGKTSVLLAHVLTLCPLVLTTIFAVLILAGVALRVMTPDERERLARRVRVTVDRAIRALKDSPGSEPFNNFLRTRTPRAIVTPVLVALNLVVLVRMRFDDGTFGDPQMLIEWGANFAPRTTNGEWWRLMSAMFVHDGLLPLLVTTTGLLPLGLLLERAVGPAAFAAVYLGAGVLANAVSLRTMPALAVTSGAAGAIFGIYGLLVASLIWGIVSRMEISIPLTTLKRIGAFAAVFFLYNLLTADLGRMSEQAGFTAGAVGGLIMARGIARQRPPVHRAAVVMAVSVVIAIATAVPVRGIIDIRSEIGALVSLEERTAGAYDAAVVRFRKGAIRIDALVALIDQKIVPELQAARARLKALRGIPPEHVGLVSAAEEYLQLRDQAWRHRADALRESDMDMLREADRAEQAALEAFRRMNQQPSVAATTRASGLRNEKVPAEVYTRAPRVYRGLEELSYPFHDRTVTVTNCGRICFDSWKINFSQVFAGQKAGITQVGDRV